MSKRGRKPKYATAEEAKEAIQEQQKRHQLRYKEQRNKWKENSSALQKHVVKELSRNIVDEEIIVQIAALLSGNNSNSTSSVTLSPLVEVTETVTDASVHQQTDNMPGNA